ETVRANLKGSLGQRGESHFSTPIEVRFQLQQLYLRPGLWHGAFEPAAHAEKIKQRQTRESAAKNPAGKNVGRQHEQHGDERDPQERDQIHWHAPVAEAPWTVGARGPGAPPDGAQLQ